jgi:RNA polymerase sigma factor (sigma-70 family)
MPDTPLALLERARAGDKDAFGMLAEEHRQALQRLCYKMTGSHEEAEDLVQETLLKAYTHIANFELRASLSTWLFRIATNTCLDSQRGKKPWDLDKRWQWFRENGELVKQMEQNLYLSPEKSAEVREVAATCVNCITMSLPEKQRAAIVLCDQMGLSREEAAKSIGASVASLKTELHRARKKMTDVYETRCQLVDGQNECDGCIVAARIQRGVGPREQTPEGVQQTTDNRQQRARRGATPARRGGAPAALTCGQLDELLSDLLADELPKAARAGVEAHLGSCDTCAASYRAMKRTVRFVQAHSNTPLEPGTPGGQYRDFTRAMMDDEYGRQPIEVIAEAVFGKKGPP